MAPQAFVGVGGRSLFQLRKPAAPQRDQRAASTETRLLHGIGWTPDSARCGKAAAPAIRTSLYGACAIRWRDAYVAPNKNSDDATEIFDAHAYKSVGLIGSSEGMIEIDFADGKVSCVGDQYGVGRVARMLPN